MKRVYQTLWLLIPLCLLSGCFEKISNDLLKTDKNKTTEKVAEKTSVTKTSPTQEPKKASAPKEPSSTPVLKAKSETTKIIEQKYPMPKIKSLADITNNWTAVPANAYPKEVTASVPLKFDLVVDGKTIGGTTIKPGLPLKPVKVHDGRIKVASLANNKMYKIIPLDQTNFKSQVTERYDNFVARAEERVRIKRAKYKQVLADQKNHPSGGSGSSNPSYNNHGESIPASDPRLGPVIASIKRGEADPTKFADVVSYRWHGTEQIRGECAGTYETVSVFFEINTIFGSFPTTYKCLLKGNRVSAWIDAGTLEKIVKE